MPAKRPKPAKRKKPNPNAGISRIDQPEKRTFGFFVRLMRKGKIYNAFFADKSHGGKRNALEAARSHYQMLVRRHGATTRRSRAETRRRPSKSGIQGVRLLTIETGAGVRRYWCAAWSPRPYQVQRKMFSVDKLGSSTAKKLAIKARAEGLRTMEE